MYQMVSVAGGDEDGGADRRIVLVGKTGAGKSATGNTILNATEIPSKVSSSTVTKQCRRRSAAVGDWIVAVTDTPDLLSAHRQNSDLQTETEECVSLCSPGVHAFLFILTLNTFTPQERDLLSRFEQIFGEDVFGFTVIVFTHGDQLQGRPVDELIRRNPELLNLINRCGGRYHVLNNANPPSRQQVNELLQKIDSMVSADGNSCYTLEMLREQRERISEEQRREEERAHREHQMNLERVRRETEEQVRREMEEEWEKERAETEVRQNRDEKKGKEQRDEIMESFSAEVCLCGDNLISSTWLCADMEQRLCKHLAFPAWLCCGGVSSSTRGFHRKVLILKSLNKICRSSPQGCPKAQFLMKLAAVLCGGL